MNDDGARSGCHERFRATLPSGQVEYRAVEEAVKKRAFGKQLRRDARPTRCALPTAQLSRDDIIHGRRMFSLLYNVPVFGLAVFWAYCRLQEQPPRRSWRSVLDVVVVAIAGSRFFGAAIPPSGHALFLTYSLITTANRYYRMAAAVMLIITIALKVSWGDYNSWFYGLLAGVISGSLWVYARGKNAEPAPPPASQ
jgi:hypothetical protein